jgi:hypothetical protein
MLSFSKNLPKIFISIILIFFSFIILYYFLNKNILEGLENQDSDSEDDDSSSCGASPAQNSGQIEFIKNSLEQLKQKVENNTKKLAKLSEAKEEVKKNRKMINQNSKSILKATGASKLSKKQDSLLNSKKSK